MLSDEEKAAKAATAAYNKAYRAVYNKEKKDKISADGKKYYAENKEEILAEGKIYHAENIDAIHETHQVYYQEHREEAIAKSILRYETKRDAIETYKEENAEAIAATLKAYKESHAEEIALWSKEYNKQPDVIFKTYKRSAKDRGYSFEITFEQFMTFWRNPCYYSRHAIETIGLDRVDSNLGYTMSNIVPCCKICNIMKMSLGVDVFKAHILSIAATLTESKNPL